MEGSRPWVADPKRQRYALARPFPSRAEWSPERETCRARNNLGGSTVGKVLKAGKRAMKKQRKATRRNVIPNKEDNQ